MMSLGQLAEPVVRRLLRPLEGTEDRTSAMGGLEATLATQLRSLQRSRGAALRRANEVAASSAWNHASRPFQTTGFISGLTPGREENEFLLLARITPLKYRSRKRSVIMKPARKSVQVPVNISRRRLTLAMSASLAIPARAALPGGTRSNILFIVVDDMDYGMFQHMPKLRRLVTQAGMEFRNHFITLTLCCPSRATILRGQFGHNTGILDNLAPYGGFGKFFLEGQESSTLATWLQAAGYRTAMMGKYLNNYPSEESGPNYIPPGWSTWFVANGGSYYSQYWYSINDNGTTRNYGGAPEDHFQNVLLRRAQQFLRSTASDPPDKPFFLFLAPFLPHKPYRAPVQYEDLFPGIQAPRTPSFNEADVSDKPAWVQRLPQLDATAIRAIDTIYRKRRQCTQALDDMVERLIGTLRTTGQLSNTYVFFTSDNGFFHGQHRIPDDKRRAYEEAIRAPLVVRGPGIPAGRVVYRLTGNVDFAPTFAALAGVTPPSFGTGAPWCRCSAERLRHRGVRPSCWKASRRRRPVPIWPMRACARPGARASCSMTAVRASTTTWTWTRTSWRTATPPCP
jgi:arylsulfatase A-like enzyme